MTAENKGVYMYTPEDLAKGRFKKTKISSESAGRLAVAGFTNPKEHVCCVHIAHSFLRLSDLRSNSL
jgi:hypothetical protein